VDNIELVAEQEARRACADIDRHAEYVRDEKQHMYDDSPAAVDARKKAGRKVAKVAGVEGEADHEWPELDPLPDAIETTPDAFPFHGLGNLLGDAARAIAEGVQAPDALAGGSVLASAALAAQGHADIQMPHGQRAPLSLFIITGALSGDRKSATDAVANMPAEEYRRQQARQHAIELEQYERDKAERKKGEPEPVCPAARSLTIGKATVEGLHMMLRNQSHIGLFTGEGGELLGGHSLREDRRSAGLAWFLKAWGAETLDTLTRGDGLSILLGRRVSLHAMVQPVLLRGLLVDPLAQGQGFLARCLVSEPGTLAGTRKFKLGDPADAPAVKRFHKAMDELLAKKCPVHQHGDGHELAPRVITFTCDASALWIEFYDEVEAEQANGGQLQGARAFASKAAEHAARIAGIITIVENPDATEVSAEAMSGAILVTSFYISEHIRLTGAGIEDRHNGLLRMLAEWIASRGRVEHKQLLQQAPNKVRLLQAKGIKPLLDELVKRGYIRVDGKHWENRP
jgi:putative DNA primase/helicase